MSAELLSSIAGVLLSLAASYIPGFSDWYAALGGNPKRLVMLAALALAAAGFSLAPLFPQIEEPWLSIVKAFIAALVANQAAFAISPRRSR